MGIYFIHTKTRFRHIFLEFFKSGTVSPNSSITANFQINLIFPLSIFYRQWQSHIIKSSEQWRYNHSGRQIINISQMSVSYLFPVNKQHHKICTCLVTTETDSTIILSVRINLHRKFKDSSSVIIVGNRHQPQGFLIQCSGIYLTIRIFYRMRCHTLIISKCQNIISVNISTYENAQH